RAAREREGRRPMTTASIENPARAVRLTGVSVSGRRLAVAWADGGTAAFPFMWLRHNCGCPVCRHPSGQRLVDVLDIPEDVAPVGAEIAADGALEVAWQPDGHASRYDAAWLAANWLTAEARTARQRRPTLWDA